MADRFPSLEEFDSGTQIEAQGGSAFEPAGADDFLSRERALLGDDAHQFVTGSDNMAFMDDDDLLGGGGGRGVYQGGEEVTEFESSFPAIDTRNENVAPGGIITGLPTSYHASSFHEDEEPVVIKEWRKRRDAALAERSARSAERKKATIKAAEQNVDDFYVNYNSKKEKSIAQTRRDAEAFLANREDTSAGGTSWERIAKLVDLSGKGVKGGATGTDKARFRDLLVSLKKDPNAPGATGY